MEQNNSFYMDKSFGKKLLTTLTRAVMPESHVPKIEKIGSMTEQQLMEYAAAAAKCAERDEATIARHPNSGGNDFLRTRAAEAKSDLARIRAEIGQRVATPAQQVVQQSVALPAAQPVAFVPKTSGFNYPDPNTITAGRVAAPKASTGDWNPASLSALAVAVFGKAAVQQLVPGIVERNEEFAKAFVGAEYSTWATARLREKWEKEQARAEKQAPSMEALARLFWERGLVVPGLDCSAMEPLNPSQLAQAQSSKTRAVGQARVEAFVAGLRGMPTPATDTLNPAYSAAVAFAKAFKAEVK